VNSLCASVTLYLEFQNYPHSDPFKYRLSQIFSQYAENKESFLTQSLVEDWRSLGG